VNGIFLIQHFFRVNTCINFRNYKFFILFLGYGFLLCLFGFFTILPRFISFWATDEISRGKHDFGIFTVFFLFFVGAMFALSLGCLFFYHLYLTAKNQSTVGMNYETLKHINIIHPNYFLESFRPPFFSYGQDKNGYDLGVRRNYQEVFGKDSKLKWFIPIFTRYPKNIVTKRK
jgi:palmitoyltransferase